MAVPLGKRLRRGIRSALIRAAAAVLSFLPPGPALALGDLGGRIAWHLSPRSRRLALAHLAVAFPEKPEAERRRIGRECFEHLGRSAMEVAAVRTFDARLEVYVSFAGDGERLLHQVLSRGRGMVFVTGHLGNWELMARRVARSGIPNVVVAKAGADRGLNAMAERFRTSGGVTTLWREDPGAGRAIIRTFREGKALGLLVDQDTRVQGVFVPFFGRLAFTPRAAADLALRFHAPVVVATTRRRGRRPGDGHVVEVTEVPCDPDAPDREAEVVRLTAACTGIIEAAIRRSPAEWVWMHQRWKTRPEDGTAQARAMPQNRALSGD
jgi:KDO2-lipid IV(A) lauroyltransferase